MSSHFQPLSVDQLAKMTEDAGYDTPAQKSNKNPLTPRSSEACAALGILPSELLPKPLSHFRQKGTSQRLQQRRWQHYEDHRQHSLSQVQAARTEIIAKEKRKRRSQGGPSTLLRGVTELDDNGVKTSKGGKRGRTDTVDTAVEQEKKRLARTQARQQAEIEQMLLQEIQRNAVAEQNKRKAEKDAERARKIDQDRKKKREAAEEIRHERERQRQREQDEMESKAKLLQQRLFHEHQASKLKKQKDEAKRRKKQNENEMLRRKKLEMSRAETQAIFHAQQKKALDSLHEMDRRDEERKRIMENRRREQMIESNQKKAEAEERIVRAQEEAAALDQKKYNDYKEKERLAAERKHMDELRKKNDREEAARVLEERRDRAHRAKRMAAQHLQEKANKVLNKDREHAMRREQQRKEVREMIDVLSLHSQ